MLGYHKLSADVLLLHVKDGVFLHNLERALMKKFLYLEQLSKFSHSVNIGNPYGLIIEIFF